MDDKLSQIISQLETLVQTVVSKQPEIQDSDKKCSNQSNYLTPHAYKISSGKIGHWASLYKEKIHDKKFMEKFRVDISKPRQGTK